MHNEYIIEILYTVIIHNLSNEKNPMDIHMPTYCSDLGEEGQCLAYTSPSGYNFNIDMNYMSI